MAQVPEYQGGVRPDSGPLVTQRGNVVPGAFGEDIARGIGEIGQRSEAAGNMLAEHAIAFQQLDNKAATDDALSKYIQASDAHRLQFQNDHQGKDAYDNYGGAVQELQAIRDDISSDLPNPAAKRDFDSASRRQEAYAVGNLTTYAQGERKRWINQSGEGLIATAKDNYAITNEPEQASDALAILEVNRRNLGKLNGEAPELTDAKVFADRSQALKQRGERLLQESPSAADAFYKANAGHFTAADQVVLEHGIKSALIPQQSRAIADEVYKPTTMNPLDALPKALEDGDAKAEALHPGDEVFRDAVRTQLTVHANRLQAAQVAVQREGIDHIQGAFNEAEQAGQIPDLNQIISTPEGQAAWAAIRPTSQMAFMNQARIASQGPRTPTIEGDQRFLALRGMSTTDPAAFAKLDLTHESKLMRTQRMQLAERQQSIIARKPLNEDVSKALSVLNANQMIQQTWPTAADKNSDEYRQFVGALEGKLDTFNAVHARKPGDADIKKIGQELLTLKSSGGFLGFFQKTTRGFQPTQEFSDGLKAAAQRAGQPEPTDDEINAAWDKR